MDFLNLQKPTNLPVATGKLLIAEPFLVDPSFARAVVLLCEHGEEGSVGFILNKATLLTLEDIFPEAMGHPLPIYQGGPVQTDTLHMLHTAPAVFGGVEVSAGVYWGGSYESLTSVLSDNREDKTDIRLMLGYAGWSPGQLDKELQEGAWIVAEPSRGLLFDLDVSGMWKRAVTALGPQYTYLTNLPIDPQLN